MPKPLPATRLTAVSGDFVPIQTASVVSYDTAAPETVVLPTSGQGIPFGGEPRFIVNEGPAVLSVIGLVTTAIAAGDAVLVVLVFDDGAGTTGWIVASSAGFTNIINPAIGAIGYAMGGFFGTNSLFSYNHVADLWTQRSNSPGTASHGSFVANGKLYVQSANPGQIKTYEWDPAGNDTWVTKADAPAATLEAATAEDGWVIGSDSVFSGGQTHKYDAVGDLWTTHAAPPALIRFFPGVLVGTEVYVFSGTTYQYDTVGDVWATVAAPLTPFENMSSAVALTSGLIIVLGGTVVTTPGTFGDAGTQVQEYDPVGDVWAARAAMPRAMYGRFAFNINDEVYAACGSLDHVNNNRTQFVDHYDPVGDVWTTLGDFPIPKTRGYNDGSAF